MKNLMLTCIVLFTTPIIAQTKTHILNTEQSVINWQGSYSFSFSEHRGTVQFKKGSLITTDGNIINGTFVIDMTTISNEDYLKGWGPVKHLRNKDFFDVDSFPEASLVITSINYFKNTNTHEVFANLKIKGISKPVKFYANVDGNKKTFKTKFIIDRTRWGITYNNELKDKTISDAVEFDVLLQF
ncbi:hypothetical protein ULMS_19680 [Patiriisocius marinistellae]|uniref:Lipid/polyisoprenoid-binding YceI-like domain-containing protein n=1 Tax=Patiriisocius marinistellae TaxID=2494560 RepID=A0A5J4FWD2_9FLAO|nr:YceI family protein [Patiriisocius marinistellae]GEQ86460.1 hypothetical protein ULMS_19680 [Patiriisocius marinistellae]